MSEDDKDRELRGYEKMLDRLRHSLTDWEADVGPRLNAAVERARENAVEFGELTRDEAEKIAAWVRRDIEEAADYSSRTGREISAWLAMDSRLVESWIWDRFASVADQTRLDWLRFQESLTAAAEYHTGEIAGPGVLTCTGCEEALHFTRPGRIPPCPRCQGSVFRRPPAEEA